MSGLQAGVGLGGTLSAMPRWGGGVSGKGGRRLRGGLEEGTALNLGATGVRLGGGRWEGAGPVSRLEQAAGGGGRAGRGPAGGGACFPAGSGV